jgi:xeroderma pigmentosum group C-complementing protein
MVEKQTAEDKSKLQATYGGDFIRTSKDFVECLLAKKGSRDTSAQLFVAILRSVGMDARLVCSLQPVSFRVAIERSDESRSSSVSKGKHRESSEQQSESSTPKVKFPFRTPRPKLSPPPDDAAQQAKITKALTSTSAKPPTVWTEVYDHFNLRWITVDPIRGFIDDPKAMEPSASSKQNVLSYVLAFNTDCDGCVDVTRRYTSHWEKTNRLRGRELTKSEKEIGKRRWWDDFYDTIQRRRRGNKEKEEEEEFEALDEQEPIPTSISRFNNHRLYALERHLKKFEVLDPNSTVLGKIKGENIYPRSAVHPVSTAETWLKQGRSIKEGEQPIKYVNARAVTLEKKRAKEIARQEGEELQVGCYASWQTERYRPGRVVNVSQFPTQLPSVTQSQL